MEQSIYLNIIAQMEESTVVSEYVPQQRDSTVYQSEAQLEEALIEQLVRQGYGAPQIHTEEELVANMRHELERLNGVTLTDGEWKRLLNEQIAGDNMTIEDKTERLQYKDSHILSLKRDDGSMKNIRLIDKKDIHNNNVQVINQYKVDAPTASGGVRKNRYDVTILVNGLPMVHVELKRRGVSIKEAFNQINRYQRDSFGAGKALFEYVQVFVISNGTQTKYYSNTTRYAQEKEIQKAGKKVLKQSNSFEFTSYWSDAQNNVLTDLTDFAATFLAKNTLLKVLTRYCVFTADKMLMVMRPYQIAAAEKILLRIATASNNKWQGTIKAGGYIWHTTGSGKTLTSFKTAQLASRMPEVDKVLFVVDRKDLDYQTMKEYDKFEKDSANSNSNSNILRRQLEDPRCRIIITTIQKLSTLLRKKDLELSVLKKNVVMIFDECHRGQFGDMHTLITRKFTNYYMFGFTGTPIFAANASTGRRSALCTTEDAFGERLHTYTIINAINDKNVLKFKVDYVSTMKMKGDVKDKKVWGIDTDEALHSPQRIANNVGYILHNFDIKTKQNERYMMSKLQNIAEVAKGRKGAKEQKGRQSMTGFNSIFAVDSVPSAIAYYREFKRQQEDMTDDERLRIATIFTFAANEAEDEYGTIDDENPEGTEQMDAVSRDALESAIMDYNKMFGTSYDTSGEKFQNYYKDVSLRMKNKEIDILIVVGMFLTGFDSQTVNTLWVDKNLRLHGLLQAYSRTNRILNAVKDCGNIVCFRNLEERTNESFALFGDKNAKGIILMRPYKDYYEGYVDDKGKAHPGYKELVERLKDEYPTIALPHIVGEELKKNFVVLFGNILKMRNLLSTFDEFNPEDEAERQQEQLVSEADMQDYTSWYNDLHDEYRKQNQGGDAENINDDIEFEMELVKQVQINIDFILNLVNEYHAGNCKNKSIVVKIQKAIGASPDMRNKKDLIERFIESITPQASGDGNDIYSQWETFIAQRKAEELDAIITEENLRKEAAYEFMSRAFSEGYVTETGTAITEVLPPMGLFGKGNKRAIKKATVLQKLKEYFDRFYELGG